jgi:phosphomannomutase
MKLVRSVSGVRGIFGESMTTETAAAYAIAFAREGGLHKVVVGRDSRPSGPELVRSALRALVSVGVEATDLGLCATPAVQVAVEEMGADGGLILTASHNPSPWNGLKFVSAAGTFLDAESIGRLFAAADGEAAVASDSAARGSVAQENRAIEWQVRCALAVPEVDLDALRGAGLRVVVDGCRSVGGPSTVMALRRTGVEVVELDCDPDGRFTRGLEPVAENIGELCRLVCQTDAHFGVAHDPDGDRAALVDECGEVMGEEFTLAIAVDLVLSHRPGPVVVNLSTSRMSEDLAMEYGVPFHRAAVGEINVVEMMKQFGAVVGGEGNGGVIVPAAHCGRDGTVAALLAAAHLATGGESLSHVRRRLGRYTMRKDRIENVDWQQLKPALVAEFTGAEPNETDGLRFEWQDEWLHVRPSGTELITRFIAQARTPARADELCDRARSCLKTA